MGYEEILALTFCIGNTMSVTLSTVLYDSEYLDLFVSSGSCCCRHGCFLTVATIANVELGCLSESLVYHVA